MANVSEAFQTKVILSMANVHFTGKLLKNTMLKKTLLKNINAFLYDCLNIRMLFYTTLNYTY